VRAWIAAVLKRVDEEVGVFCEVGMGTVLGRGSVEQRTEVVRMCELEGLYLKYCSRC
jgi:hypothetical protein